MKTLIRAAAFALICAAPALAQGAVAPANPSPSPTTEDAVERVRSVFKWRKPPRQGDTADAAGSQQPTPTPSAVPAQQTEKERQHGENQRKRAAEAEAKAARKTYEAEKKERRKRPPSAEVAAPSDRVGALLVQRLAADGWQIELEGKYGITVSKALTGWRGSFGAAMLGDGTAKPMHVLRFTLAEVDGRTHVTATAALVTPRRYGRANGDDTTKKNWDDLSVLLEGVKADAERR